MEALILILSNYLTDKDGKDSVLWQC